MKKSLFVFIIWSTVYAHVYQIQIARRWSDQLKEYQYIIGFSDQHSILHAKNQDHKKQFFSFLDTVSPSDCKLIVEDLSSPNYRGKRGCNTFFFNSKGGFLGGMSTAIASKGFDVCNVEYRYCRAAGWGTLYSGLYHKKIARIKKNMVPAIPTALIHDEVVNTIDVIQNNLNLTSSHELASDIQSSLCTVKTNMNNLPWLKDTKKTINAHTAHFQTKQAVEELLTFDSPLLDLLIINTIQSSHNKRLIMIIAGGTHIKKTFHLLKKQGYELLVCEPINSLDQKLINRIINLIRRN